MKITPGEGPLKRRGGPLIVAMESKKMLFKIAGEEKSFGVRTFLWTIEK
jgi:hypothetical protein